MVCRADSSGYDLKRAFATTPSASTNRAPARCTRRPAWDPRREIREQRGWDDHAAFSDGLVDDGFVVLGGPVGYDQGALLLVESSDEQEIRARFADDPWVRSEVLCIGSVAPWLLWLDSRPEASRD